jgi:signal transduction histidine kinase
LGILTSGVAHELGNPLNNISMVAQTYLELYDRLGGEDRIEYMKTVLEESERIKKIVQDLLDFSRPKKADFKVGDINSVIRNSLKLVQNTLDISKIKSQLNLEESLPAVFIDEDRIREVLVNLLSNAVHAMPSGGSVFLRTRLAEDQENIIIEVEDTGKGIRQEFISYIFDPFFSTKGAEGTGLGLSISYGIVRRHNGKMDVRSKVGVGTTFVIELPIYKGKENGNE